MKIAIASGKGGTGKTTVSASLSRIWPSPVTVVDLDVEEPNLHLFLKPHLTDTEKAFIEVPIIDESRCTFCRACAELCQFKAISILGHVALVFSDMCHGCGGCMAICPTQAISAGQRELGKISWGTAGPTRFLMGRLRVGEAMSPPLMKAVKSRLDRMQQESQTDVILDTPPGVSCPAVNAVMDSDVIVLVTEPTPFGLYDLKLAAQAFTPIQIPMAVVIYRSGSGDSGVADFCRDADLPILAHIAYDPLIARAYVQGKLIVDAVAGAREQFVALSRDIHGLQPPPSMLKEVGHA